MILIIFLVNTSAFAYFFFTSWEIHEGRQPLLVPPLTGWLSYWAVLALDVQLPLRQLCNLNVSYIWGAVRKNNISDRFSTKTAISAHI